MKKICLLFVFLFIAGRLVAQNPLKIATDAICIDGPYNLDGEIRPEFPGGINVFYKYLQKNLKYPIVARLIGINGKLNMLFTVGTSGSITEATPKNCLGAGCEAEAARLLRASPRWKPGSLGGRPTKFQYAVPLTFSIENNDQKVLMKELRASGYGFVFKIKDLLYTIDEAETILGKSFKSTQVQIAEPFYNYNKVAKFNMPDKKETYLIIIKST